MITKNLNQKIQKLAKTFFDKYFWRQHPEAALRYLPVVTEIKKKKLQKSKILEIGPGSLGITPYLQSPIDGLDVDFTGPKSNYLKEIQGTADNLPFRKNSYDVVISADVLEHLPKEKRQQALSEIIRVAKKLAVIVVPTGQISEKQDRQLNYLYQKIHKKHYQYLEEHVGNGLPKTEEILVQIDKSLRRLNKKAKIKSRPILNLLVRKILMKTWISNNKFLYYLYMKGYLLLLPILIHANFGNCYRRIFVIEFSTN